MPRPNLTYLPFLLPFILSPFLFANLMPQKKMFDRMIHLQASFMLLYYLFYDLTLSCLNSVLLRYLLFILNCDDRNLVK